MTARDARVDDVMSDHLVAVGERLTLRSLAAVLGELDVGAALVEAPDATRFVVTERDIVRALGDGADPDVVWTADVVSADLVVCDPSTSVVDAADRMNAAGVRHLAVVDHGEICGVVSVRDLLPPLVER